MKRRLLILSITLSLSVAAAEQRVVTLPDNVQQQTTYLGKEYLLYVPDIYATAKAAPLLIFLHGKGESGDNIERVQKHGPPKLIAAGKTLPFIVVSPQCKRKENGKVKWNTADLDVLLEHIKATYPIDDRRIYLSGMSMGGYGAWAWAAKRPNTFAAIAVICGGSDPKKAKLIAHLPAHVFHGAHDDRVPIEKSKAMVAALEEHGSSVKFTIYPDAGHDSWTKTYANTALYDWLAKQRKKDR